MTNPALAKTTSNGRVYRDTLPHCPLLDELGYQVDPDTAYPSVTAVIGAGIPKQVLTPWAAKAVAECAWQYLAEGDEGVEKLLNEGRRSAREWIAKNRKRHREPTDDEVRDHALRYLKQAPDRIRDVAAARGNDVHEIVERLAAGQVVPTLGDDLEPWIRSARAFVADFRPKVIWSEVTVFNRKWKYAGTLDLIADFPGIGRRKVDYKSGNQVYGDTGVQLAAYGNAEYGIVDGIRQPLPDGIDGGLVVHLTADGYEVIPVECGDRQMDAFIGALLVADHCWGADKLLGEPLRPVNHTDDDLALTKAWLTRRIQVLIQKHPDVAKELGDSWPKSLPTMGKPAHTPDELEQIEALLDTVEDAHSVPFGEAKPAPAGAQPITSKRKRKQPEGKEQAA